MFDSLLGPKFSNKCKHSVKCIKCRMETIRKKKQAMERYLKKDVADLVSTGHDINAFSRMDALLFEINQTSCYYMIEQYCCCILEHLPTMQKERECPKETVEAVATLIFAAARFSDLPELADLRRGFTERYRTTMESYTNREFVEKLQKKSFPRDEKLQLMKDIAKEFNIDWDVKSFECKMSYPLAPTIDHPNIHLIDRRNEGLDGRETVLEKTNGRREVTDRRNEIVNGRKPVFKKAEGTTHLESDLQKQQIEFEKLKTVNNNEDQKIIQMEGDKRHSKSPLQNHQVRTEEPRNTPTITKKANAHRHDSTEKIKEVAADESENVEPHHFSKRPPYVKTKDNQNRNIHRRSEVHERPGFVGTERRGETRNDKAINTFPTDSKFTDFNGTNSYHDGFVLSTTEEVVKEMEQDGQQRQPNGAVNPESKRASNLKPPYVKPKVKSLLETSYVKPTNYEMCSGSDNGDDHKNTAFSVRRKHLAQGTAAHAGTTGEDGNLRWKISTQKSGVVVKNNVMHMDLKDQQGFFWQSKQIEDDAIDGNVYHDRRMHRTNIDQTIYERRSINATYDEECDKEGEKMDKLLQRYSKKGVSNEPGETRADTREPQTQSIFGSSRVPEKTIKDEQYTKFSAHTPTRTASLHPTETLVGRHIHSVSMQSDLLSPNGGHAHPRLPDYDDLAARIASLRKS